MAAVLVETTAVSAEVLTDNLGNASGGSFPVSDAQFQAQQFKTGNADFNLSAVTLLMLRSSESGEALVQIWTDTGGDPAEPDLAVHTLTSPASYSSSLASTLFTTTGFQLAANSSYWVVLSAAGGGGEFEWSFTSDASGAGAGFSTEWRESLTSGDIWSGGSDEPYQMKIEGAAIPEPAAPAALSALAVLSAVWLRRRA